MSVDDHGYMARALRLAARGIATTDPNPAVGCVLVRGGEIVGEGYTAPAGGPHAEVRALTAAGGRARGATAYVSLEPCAHHGRTGPCADALIAAGVARVVCAARDPNPLVAGGGAAALEAAGIEVAIGLLETWAREINCGFFSRHERGRPWVRLKLAGTLDGRTALAGGESQWITSEPARADVHRWRARSSAVMTGVGTVLADDPLLTARPREGDLRQPMRVVLDSALRTPPTARTLAQPGGVCIFTGVGPVTEALADSAGAARDRSVARAGAEADTEVAAEKRAPPDAEAGARGAALVAAGARIETVPADPRCDLAAVLARLAALEINTVWLEAGPILSGAMVAAGFVDEYVVYLAPDWLGDTARGMLTLPPLARLDDRVRLALTDVRRIGRDLRVRARPDTVARARNALEREHVRRDRQG